MRGAISCVGDQGMSGFSLEDVAHASGVSRTSIYRHFPGGRQQLVEETATWEVGRFWAGLAEAVSGLDSLEDRLVQALVLGSARIGDSVIVANLMEPDLDELIGALQPAEPLVHAVVVDYMTELLRREQLRQRLRPGVDVDRAADYLTRMVMSVMSAPGGVDLRDPEQTRAVVRREFLAGIIDGP